MPSFDIYSKLARGAKTGGEQRKADSDWIIESIWNESIESRIAYIYDFYHDSEPLLLSGLSSDKDELKIPLDIKYLKNSSQTYNKDQVTFHIQMKPSQKCNVPYYDKFFSKRYGAKFPIGLYCDIPNRDGVFDRWLIVGKANYYDMQFPTYEVLPCDKILQYVFNGEKRQIPVVLQSQNSYNSGIWASFKFTVPEDQQKFVIPLNRDTENLYYNQRIIMDAPVLTEPRTWQITKVNRISSSGLAVITLAQDLYNPNTDYIEKNPNTGEVVGMWADYWTTTIQPTEPILPPAYSEILINSDVPEIKVGGNGRLLTAVYFDENRQSVPKTSYSWSFDINGITPDSKLFTVIYPLKDSSLKDNQIKIFFADDDTYLHKNLNVKCLADGDETEKEIAIVGL